jgi:hypothetical protein
MAILGALAVVGGLVLAVLLIAWYIFPNVICTMEIAEGSSQERGQLDPLVEICSALRQ